MERSRQLVAELPEYAAELRLNFDAIVVRHTALTQDQLWGTLVACAMAARCRILTDTVLADAAQLLPPEVLASAQTAAAMMTLTNGFYRQDGLLSLEERSGLRMNSLRRQRTVPAEDFALWCLAVSAFHGCERCVAAQERTLQMAHSSPERRVAVLRVQALVGALAVVLDADASSG